MPPSGSLCFRWSLPDPWSATDLSRHRPSCFNISNNSIHHGLDERVKPSGMFAKYPSARVANVFIATRYF